LILAETVAPVNILTTVVGCGMLAAKGAKNVAYAWQYASFKKSDYFKQGFHSSDFYKGWSAQEFKNYFIEQGMLSENPTWEQQDLFIRNLSLYGNKGFEDFIKTLPAYEQIIQNVDREFQQGKLESPYSVISFGSKRKLKNILSDLARKAKKAVCKNNQAAISRERFEYAAHAMAALKKTLNVRSEAQRQILEKQGCNAIKSYSLSSQELKQLTARGYDLEQYAHCDGNQLNHALHKEALKILHELEYAKYINADLKEDIYAFNDTGLFCNHQGDTDRAIMFSDLCWSMLDFAKYGINGAVDGAERAITAIMHHPTATIFSIAAARGLIIACPSLSAPYLMTFQLSIILGDIGFSYWQDPSKGAQKWNDYTQRFNIVLDWLINEQSQYTAKEVFGQVVSVGVEWVVENKIISCLTGFFGRAKNKVKHLARKFSGDPQKILTTPDGVQIKFADDSLNRSSSKLRSKDAGWSEAKKGAKYHENNKKNNVRKSRIITPAQKKEYIKMIEKEGFRKIRHRSPHGEAIYKKGRKYISFDKDGHNGGVWKMANSLEGLLSRNKRLGTYNEFLKYIGD
jgi:hypothetical protein